MKLHDKIMNLAADVNQSWVGPGAYKAGHRDARHAAAELAAEYESVVAELVGALEAVQNMHSRYCDRVGATDEWAAEIMCKVKAALARHKGMK